MAWKSKYVVYRPNSSKLEEVFSSDELKKANYWIKYIAQENDALFMTPLHPKKKDNEQPGYYSHKISPGEVKMDETVWKEQFGSLEVPSGQE